MSQEPGRSGFNRRDLLKTTAAGSMAAYGAGFLAACGSGGGGGSSRGGGAGGSAPAQSPGPPQGGTPVRGGSLRVGLTTAGEEENLNVLISTTIPDLTRVQNLYDPLFFVGDHGAVEPALVSEAHPNADASVWTFRLRDGVTWHDGKPFSADDVVYTIQKSWGSSENLFNAVLKQFVDFKNVRKSDDLTVEVPLLLPIAEFPSVTCIQNTYVIQAGTTNFDRPVGTGPFVYESFSPGVRSVFKANKDYWIKGQPYVDELVIDSSFSDPNTAMNALLSDQIDILPGAPPALAKANADAGKIYVGNIEGPGWCAPMARVDRAPFTNKKVLSALKLMSDRDAIVKSVFDGYGTPGNDCPGSTLKYWAADLKGEHDPEKAKALLKEAGEEDLKLTLQASTVTPGMLEMATVFAQQASEAGAHVEVKQIDPSVYYSAAYYLKRDFGMEQFTNGVNSLPMFYLNSLYPGAPFNETYWGEGSEAPNKLLRAALGELDESKAAEKWHAVQELQHREGGMLIFANYNWVDGYSTKVRGVKTTNAGQCDNYTFRGGWLSA